MLRRSEALLHGSRQRLLRNRTRGECRLQRGPRVDVPPELGSITT